MAYGDHIYVERGFITHHGVEMADGWVIHLASADGTRAVQSSDGHGSRTLPETARSRFAPTASGSAQARPPRVLSRCSGSLDTTSSRTTASTSRHGALLESTAVPRSRRRCHRLVWSASDPSFLRWASVSSRVSVEQQQ